MRFGNTSEAKIRKNLRASAADGAAFGGMVGIGETYLAAFALAVGMSELTAGMVASLPMLAGGVMQLLSLRAVRWFGSEQRWILFGASIQACAFLPLVYAALQGEISSARLLLVASIYWGAGLATGPAWNVWIENLVPSRVRTRYFAVRSRLAQLTTLGGFLIGGALLAWGQSIGQVLWAFPSCSCLPVCSGFGRCTGCHGINRLNARIIHLRPQWGLPAPSRFLWFEFMAAFYLYSWRCSKGWCKCLGRFSLPLC